MKGGVLRSEGTMTVSGQDGGASEGANDELAARQQAAWQDAMTWVMRQHEQALAEADLVRLDEWLAASALNRQAYEQARQVWQLTGAQPPDDT